MLGSVNGADVIGGNVSLGGAYHSMCFAASGGSSCCGSIATTGFLQQWALSNCSLAMDTTYIFLMLLGLSRSSQLVSQLLFAVIALVLCKVY